MDDKINYEADLDSIRTLRASPVKNPNIAVDKPKKRDILTINQLKQEVDELEERIQYIELVLQKNLKYIKELKNTPTAKPKPIKSGK